MSGALWTPKMIDLLTELWAEGLSARQIADRLPREITRNGVIGKSHRLGLPKRPNPILRDYELKPKVARPVRASRVVIGGYLARARSPHHRRPKQEVPVTDSPGLTLEQTQDVDGCRWPVSMSLKDTVHRFCGLPRARAHLPFVADPSPYCCLHSSGHTQHATGSIKAAEKFPGWAA